MKVIAKKDCKQCGISFGKRPKLSYRQFMDTTFCSRKCRAQASKGQTCTEETRQKLVKAGLGRIPWNKGLRGYYMPPLSEERKLRLSLTFRGERSHFWKGGVSKETRIARSSYEYKKWRKSVLDRDGHKCVTCGSTEELQADHIKMFAHFPQLRFDINNGRTLCAPCHRETPSWGNNRLVCV